MTSDSTLDHIFLTNSRLISAVTPFHAAELSLCLEGLWVQCPGKTQSVQFLLLPVLEEDSPSLANER